MESSSPLSLPDLSAALRRAGFSRAMTFLLFARLICSTLALGHGADALRDQRRLQPPSREQLAQGSDVLRNFQVQQPPVVPEGGVSCTVTLLEHVSVAERITPGDRLSTDDISRRPSGTPMAHRRSSTTPRQRARAIPAPGPPSSSISRPRLKAPSTIALWCVSGQLWTSLAVNMPSLVPVPGPGRECVGPDDSRSAIDKATTVWRSSTAEPIATGIIWTV